jgi:hypothetical protein
VIEELQRRVRQRLKDGDAMPDKRAGIAKLEREMARPVDAIASGTLRASAAIAQRLKVARRPRQFRGVNVNRTTKAKPRPRFQVSEAEQRASPMP